MKKPAELVSWKTEPVFSLKEIQIDTYPLILFAHIWTDNLVEAHLVP